MYEELKHLARSNCLDEKENNFLSMLINRNDAGLNLRFRQKPASPIRRHLRLIGFTWSRKNKYWRSHLNNTQVARVSKFYRNHINKNN